MSIELETRIDQLIRQNAALAAENERLQAVIDEANAQEPLTTIQVLQGYPHVVSHSQCGVKDGIYKVYAHPIPAQQSIEQAHMAGQADAGVDPSYSNAKAYAISIGAQQSPAVALPEFTDAAWNAMSEAMDSRGYSDSKNDMDRDDYKALFDAALQSAAPSPRITEQDAREIIEAVAHIGVDFGYGAFEIQPEMIEKCRALLNKLNGDKNGK